MNILKRIIVAVAVITDIWLGLMSILGAFYFESIPTDSSPPNRGSFIALAVIFFLNLLAIGQYRLFGDD